MINLADSIDVLEAQGTAAQKVAVLGTMLELGPGSSVLHEEILRDAWGRDIDLLVVTGEFAAAARTLAAGDGIGPNDEEAEISERLVRAETWREVYPALKGRLKGDEIVLLKASRGIALEGILPLLSEDFTSAGIDSVEA